MRVFPKNSTRAQREQFTRRMPKANPNRIPNTRFQRILSRMGACDEARKWVGSKTLAQAWKKINDVSWMVYLLRKLDFVECTCSNTSPRENCPIITMGDETADSLRKLYTPTLAMAERRFPPQPR